MEHIYARNFNEVSKANHHAAHDDDLHYSKIFVSAVNRASEAVRFFEEKGAACSNGLKRAFFLYMSVKKDAQRLIIEKIARSQGIEVASEHSGSDPVAGIGPQTAEVEDDFHDIFNIVHEIAADELEFYLNYAAVEKDTRINAILLMLADLSKEFLFDVKIWYLNHKDAEYIEYGEFQGSPAPDYEGVPALD
jgi:hypothetical protein